MIRLDGSIGEGGGQILRTALALSLVTGKSFRIDNIRARRERPGLQRQHLAAVNAAGQVGCAQVEGAVLGSQTFSVTPAALNPGGYHFYVGSAGRATPLFQKGFPAPLTPPGGTTPP